MTILHAVLICKNWTTLEATALMQERNIFKDQTVLEAWEQTMGKNKWLWFLPVGGPLPEQGLDYHADIPVAGVINERPALDEELKDLVKH